MITMTARCDRPEIQRRGYWSPYRCTLPEGHDGACKWTQEPVLTRGETKESK